MTTKISSKYLISKKSGRNFCDELWTKLVRLEFNSECPICKSMNLPLEDKMLNCHHLISRRVFKYRWDVDNGILICPKHHEFCLELSAHTAPWAFEDWMKNNLPEKYNKWVENRNNIHQENNPIYDEIYLNLENQHKKKTGEYYKIQRIQMYLLSLNKEKIIFAHKMQNEPITKIAERYNATEASVKKFLKL
jgi:hypothetical protein